MLSDARPRERTRIGADALCEALIAQGVDVIFGQSIPSLIHLAAPDFGTGVPQVQAQKIRPLAVLTKTRNSALPDVPTLNETVLPGFDLIAWTGIFAPAGTPPEIVNTLAKEVEKSLAKPEFKKQFATLGLDVFWAGPQDYQKYVKTELEKWTGMIKESGIQPE